MGKFKSSALAIAFALTSFIARDASAKDLRVVTYNIAMGYALKVEGKAPFLSLASALGKQKDLKGLEILGTQEICGNEGGWQIAYFEDFFRKQYGEVHTVFKRSDPNVTNDCETGQAIFSRYPFEDSGYIDLPQIRPVGKVLIWATINVNGQRIRVYNIHLDNRGKGLIAEQGRWTQVQPAIEHAERFRADNPDAAVIFLGDFNAVGNIVDIWRREKTIVEMSKRFTPNIDHYVPTHWFGWHLDWIFFDRLSMSSSKPVHIVFSDHFPVVANFDVPDGP